MKIKNVQSIICLAIFFLFANQAGAAEWIYFDTAAVGDVYYDKSSIKKVNKNIIQVWNKNVLSKEAKTKYFSLLKEIHQAPQNPSMLSYYKKLMEIDCVNRKIKDIFVIFYNEKGKVIYSSPKSDSGEWNDILPNTVGEKLINIVSCEPVTPSEAVVASKVDEPLTPKEVAVAAAPAVNYKDPAQVTSNQSDWVEFCTSTTGNDTSYKKAAIEKGREKYVIKDVFSDQGRKEYIQDRTEKGLSTVGYEKLSNIQSLSEIDCKKKMIMSISVSHFDTEGIQLDSKFNDKPKWVKIRSNSFFDSLQKEVCK